MLLYDWKKLRKATNGSSRKIVNAVEALLLKQSKQLPRNKFDRTFPFYYADLSGQDFLVNAPLLMRKRHFYSAKEVAEYIALASYRPLANYLLTKDATLDLFLSPIGQDAINSNRLLRIEQDKIHFLYEDHTKG